MTGFWAVIVGVMFAAGTFLMLRRHLAKLILGLILMSNAANLLIFTAGGLNGRDPVIIGEGGTNYADPLPQVLILTAIVISFGVMAYFLTLLRKTYKSTGTEDLERIQEDT